MPRSSRRADAGKNRPTRRLVPCKGHGFAANPLASLAPLFARSPQKSGEQLGSYKIIVTSHSTPLYRHLRRAVTLILIPRFLSVLHKEEDESLELFTAEDLTGNLVRVWPITPQRYLTFFSSMKFQKVMISSWTFPRRWNNGCCCCILPGGGRP